MTEIQKEMLSNLQKNADAFNNKARQHNTNAAEALMIVAAETAKAEDCIQRVKMLMLTYKTMEFVFNESIGLKEENDTTTTDVVSDTQEEC